MSIHSSGDGYGTHDARLIYEARCPECRLDHAPTIRLIRAPVQPSFPAARKAAILDAVVPRLPWWRRQPGWLAGFTVAGMSVLIVACLMGLSVVSAPVIVALVAALSGPAYGAAARWRARRS